MNLDGEIIYAESAFEGLEEIIGDWKVNFEFVSLRRESNSLLLNGKWTLTQFKDELIPEYYDFVRPAFIGAPPTKVVLSPEHTERIEVNQYIAFSYVKSNDTYKIFINDLKQIFLKEKGISITGDSELYRAFEPIVLKCLSSLESLNAVLVGDRDFRRLK